MIVPSCEVVGFPKVTSFTGRASELYFSFGVRETLEEVWRI